MTKWYRDALSRRTILPTSLAVATVGVGVAVWAAGPFPNQGSDTLGDVAPDTITASGASLTYQALGSGQAETDMLAGTQTLGFMSRNFKQTILNNHGTWQPDPTNVLGLDAASIVAPPRGTLLRNVALPQNPANPGHAMPESMLSLILSGYQAQGTAAACRHPNRLQAISDFENLIGGTTLTKFYRRNDASGTSDTIRERVMTTATGTSGGRFCNGQAPGGQKADLTLYTNMDAEDMDPIRGECPAAGALNPTKCIFWPYNVTCTNGQTSVGGEVTGMPAGIACTQGLVVAITQADPGRPDVTLSIAYRVNADPYNGTFGYAGREAVKQGNLTFGPKINGISNADLNVRANAYPLSRRLFLNHGDNPAAHVTAAQQAEEDTLYNYATSDRCNMHDIMKKWGFVTCYKNCNLKPTDYNLCDDSNIPAAETTMGLCVAEGKTCASGALCCGGATCPTDTLKCPVVTHSAAAGESCSTDLDCQTGTCQDLGGATPVCAP